MACFVCGNDEFKTLFNKGSKRFFRCLNCRLVFLDPMPSALELDAFYEQDYIATDGGGTVLDSSERTARITARNHLKSLMPFEPAEPWLDVGCSTGIFLHELQAAGIRAEGIEISATAVAKAAARGLTAYVGTLNDFVPQQTYRTVTALDVIEHLLNPPLFLEQAHSLLESGGILALTTPDTGSWTSRLMGRYWSFYMPDRHLFYFNKHNLSSLLIACGFQIIGVRQSLKSISYDHVLYEFEHYTPTAYAVLSLTKRVLPSTLRAYPWKLPLGEMMIVARRI